MTPLDYLAKEYVELTMVKQRYDLDDVYFFVDRPFWKRDSLNFSHEYKFAPGTPVPEYPARSLNNILVEAERLLECLKSYRATVGAEEEMRNDYLIAVSYTHLDVYKRQLQRFVQYTMNVLDGFCGERSNLGL